MKKFAMIALLAVFTSGAFAAVGGTDVSTAPASVATAQQQQQQQTNAVSGAAATNAGNSQSITFTSPPVTTSTVTQTVNSSGTLNQNVTGDTTSRQVISGGTTSTVTNNNNEHIDYGTQTIRNTPSVSASPLVSSNDTCMGSATGAVNVPGFGLGLGKTYTDDNCVMLKNGRELWNMGMKGAAMALMCTNAANREALEMTGYECPQTKRDRERAVQTSGAQTQVNGGEPTDPIVRSRMGLAPLAR